MQLCKPSKHYILHKNIQFTPVLLIIERPNTYIPMLKAQESMNSWRTIRRFALLFRRSDKAKVFRDLSIPFQSPPICTLKSKAQSC